MATFANPRYLLSKLVATTDRRRFRSKLIQVAAWCIAVPVIAWVISGWFWDLIAPPLSPMASPVQNVEPQAVAQTVAGRHLFGVAASNQPNAAPATALYQVIGLMTASRGVPGFAILSKAGNNAPLVALEGDTIEPGVKLVEVLPKQARLLVNGRAETIDAPDASQSPATPATPVAAANPPQATFGTTNVPTPQIPPRRPRP